MAFTYVLSTDRGKVRLMIPDRTASDPIFDDDEIDAFLTIEGGNIKRATAMALETIAADQVLVLKVITLMDLRTDGAAVSRELLKRAADLRSQAEADEASDEGGAFDIAEMVVDPFTERERTWKEMQRGL